MTRTRFVGHGLAALVLACLPGCAWKSWWSPPPAGPTAPRVFAQTPNIDEVVQHLNTNCARVTSLRTDRAGIYVPDAPRLRAVLLMEPPRRFRLRADTSFTGPELDMGSNDDVFWIWARRNTPPAVYYARHEHFGRSPLGQLLPIQPSWLGETLGLIRVDPTDQLEGPYARNNNQIEIRIRQATGQGITKVLVLDGTYGWLRELHAYDPQGRLLASAVASLHRFYPTIAPQTGVSLPHRVEFRMPATDMNIQLDIDQYTINPPLEDNPMLWSMPVIEGSPAIDVGGGIARSVTPPVAGGPPAGGHMAGGPLAGGPLAPASGAPGPVARGPAPVPHGPSPPAREGLEYRGYTRELR